MRQSLCLLTAASILVAGLVPGVSALEPGLPLSQHTLRAWTTQHGLPLNAVTAVTGTRDGYLWVGTQDGLARFDGITFTGFHPGAPQAMVDPFVSVLAEDAGGRLWIGTRKGLLSHEDGVFRRWTVDDGLPHEYVRSLLADPRGGLWIGTYGGGLARWQEGRITTYGEDQGLDEGVIRVLLEDSAGTLWVGTAGGLFLWRGERFERAGAAEGLDRESIRALAEDGQGTLWIAADGGRLVERREGAFRKSSVLDGTAFGTAQVQVSALYRDRQDDLWIGTRGGGLLRQRFGRLERLQEQQGLAGDVVWSLFEDRGGSLWVGTRTGLTQVMEPRIVTYGEEEGLAEDFVRTVLEDRWGRVWIGTGGSGVFLLDERKLEPAPGSERLPSPHVRALMEDREGQLWVGTRGGVARLTGPPGPSLTVEDGLPSESVNALLETRRGEILVGTARGLVVLAGGEARPWPPPAEGESGLEGALVRRLLEDRRGRIWVGTETGLFRVSGAKVEHFTTANGLPGDFVYALYEAPSGTLWIGTDAGFGRWRGNAFETFEDPFNTLRGPIFEILEDHRRQLWLTGPRGLLRVEKGSLEALALGQRDRPASTWFGEADGLDSAECNGGTQPAGWRTRDGRLWIPTTGGAALADPEVLEPSRESLAVVLESVLVDGDPTPPEGSFDGEGSLGPPETAGGGTAAAVQDARLEPGAPPLYYIHPLPQTIVLRYTAPAFRTPQKVRFRYRLEGFDRRWTEAGTRREAIYTGLPPGRYRFRLAATNEDGIWGAEETVSALLVVDPALYQTRWFQALLVLLLLGGLAAVYQYRRRQRALREELLRQEVAERTHQLEEANRQLERLAAIDPLTGIANQRTFRTILDQEWRRAARTGAELALLLIDVDYFKAYNDTYGHLAGDRALTKVAQALDESMSRAGDTVARYGGEEFAAVLAGVDREGARLLGEKVRAAVEDLRIEHTGSQVSSFVTVSVGVAAVRPSPEALLGAVEQLVGEADAALYASKRSGRNRVT